MHPSLPHSRQVCTRPGVKLVLPDMASGLSTQRGPGLARPKRPGHTLVYLTQIHQRHNWPSCSLLMWSKSVNACMHVLSCVQHFGTVGV